LKIFKTIQSIKKRHEKNVVVALLCEVYIRMYQIHFLRPILRFAFKKESPRGWVFVTGCYNAGTTVVKNAIGLHPDISSAPIEGDVLTSAMPNFEQGGFPRGMYGNAVAIRLHREFGSINRELAQSDWRPWIFKNKFFCDKSISQTVRIGLLRESFNNSRFVCVTRNPDNVVGGIQKRSVPNKQATVILGSKTYPDCFLKKQWAFIYGLVLRDYDEEDTFFCSYEDFVSNPAKTVGQLYSFLNLRPVDITIVGHSILVHGKKLSIRPPMTKPTDTFRSYGSIKLMVNKINLNREIS